MLGTGTGDNSVAANNNNNYQAIGSNPTTAIGGNLSTNTKLLNDVSIIRRQYERERRGHHHHRRRQQHRNHFVNNVAEHKLWPLLPPPPKMNDIDASKAKLLLLLSSLDAMPKFNEQSVHRIIANGNPHRDETNNHAEIRTFTPTDRNSDSVDGHLLNGGVGVAAIENAVRRKRRHIEQDAGGAAAPSLFATADADDDDAVAVIDDNDNVRRLYDEGSGDSDSMSSVTFALPNAEQQKRQAAIENGGNSWFGPQPLAENNAAAATGAQTARYQFDGGDDRMDGLSSDIENVYEHENEQKQQQHRKLDVSNLMVEKVEPLHTTFKMPSNFDNEQSLPLSPPSLHNEHDNSSSNNNPNSPHSTSTNDSNESFELITDSFHESFRSAEENDDDNNENVERGNSDSSNRGEAASNGMRTIIKTTQLPSSLSTSSSSSAAMPSASSKFHFNRTDVNGINANDFILESLLNSSVSVNANESTDRNVTAPPPPGGDDAEDIEDAMLQINDNNDGTVAAAAVADDADLINQQQNHNHNHKPEDNDNDSSALQNDSPAIIIRYDKQPILIGNQQHLVVDAVDSSVPSSGVDEQTTIMSTTTTTSSTGTVRMANIDTNLNRLELNANANTNGIEMNAAGANKMPQPSIETVENGNGNTNNIDALANSYIESSADLKHNEPQYEMLDVVHNKSSIESRDNVHQQQQHQRNMQRILVNVSIGTDSGDGTQNHGIYMLHVSVPAGPNLMPAYFNGNEQNGGGVGVALSPQTAAIHEPPIFIKPMTTQQSNSHAHGNGNLNGKSTEAAALPFECSSEISRLNSIIANLNKTQQHQQHSISSSRSGNESLIATKNQNENQMTMTAAATTVSDYNANDNRINETTTNPTVGTTAAANNNNNNNFCLCNQDIPPILILEGKRFCLHKHTQTQ